MTTASIINGRTVYAINGRILDPREQGIVALAWEMAKLEVRA